MDNYATFGNNIRYLLEKNDWKQYELANKLKLTPASVSKWVKGKSIPEYATLVKVADIFGVNPVDTLVVVDLSKEEKSGDGNEPKDYLTIKVFGTIPAGLPNHMWDEPIGEEDIPKDWKRGGKEYFGLKVSGDSMYPEYMDGDVVICRKQSTCESGQDCVVRVNGDEATFKKVVKQDGIIVLQPINPAYKPRFFTGRDDDPEIEILGVVIELRRTIRQ